MIPVSDTLLIYAVSGCSGDDFLAVFKWLLVDRDTELPNVAKLIAKMIAEDQDKLLKSRAAKIAHFRSFLKRQSKQAKREGEV